MKIILLVVDFFIKYARGIKMQSPACKRQRLTSLDESSSSSDSDSDDDITCNADIDQVPIFLLSGRWLECYEEMKKELSVFKSAEFATRVMHIVATLKRLPWAAKTMHEFFFSHCELGIAYLVLFRSRHRYYEIHFGRRWRRGTNPQILPEFAHADVSVSPSNPSGILRVPMQYAMKESTVFLDLGMGQGSYLRNMPAELRAGGYEINTNPLMLDQVLSNITSYHPTFCFIPMDFSKVRLPSGIRYTLFSWHPGTHEIPDITACDVTAFFKGAKFENLESQGLCMAACDKSIVFYKNHSDFAPVQWSSEEREDSEKDDDFVQALSSFDLPTRLNDNRKIRSQLASLEDHLGCTLGKWKTHEELQLIISGLPRADYARWVLYEVKWSLVKQHLLDRCHCMTTRMLLSCGVPQSECRRRIETLLLSQTI